MNPLETHLVAGRWIDLLTSSLLSKRGLICVAFLLATFLATWAPWLRPPLSSDLRGCEIPLGFVTAVDPVDVVYGARSVRFDSPGVLILLAIIPATALALWKPRYVGLFGGTLLCAAIVAHAMVVSTHPGMFEIFEQQHRQRRQMVAALDRVTAGEAMADASNGRTNGPVFRMENYRWMSSAWRFALYGAWLVPLAIAIVFFGGSGSLEGRSMKFAGWAIAALAISTIVCRERILAESHWQRSWQLTHQANYALARHELTHALDNCPALRHLQRTWRLAGKLDFFSQRETSQLAFYRSFQLAGQNALAEAADLLEAHMARPEPPRAIYSLACDIAAQRGLQRLLGNQSRKTVDERTTQSACDIWQKAIAFDSHRTDSLLYSVLDHARFRGNVDFVADAIQQLLGQIADRALCADILATMGDVYFESGEFEVARYYYSQSRKQFELPKKTNFRARRGLLGT